MNWNRGAERDVDLWLSQTKLERRDYSYLVFETCVGIPQEVIKEWTNLNNSSSRREEAHEWRV
jgi:hypothetical protein